MSKFRPYARKADEIAKSAFATYKTAESAYNHAAEQRQKFPMRSGAVDAEYAEKSARFEANYQRAKLELDNAKATLRAKNDELKAIRQQLSAAVSAEYAAMPDLIDSNTIELLKCGILCADEFSRLYSDFQRYGNNTMCRVIGKYAAEKAVLLGEKEGNSEEVRALKAIECQSLTNSGSEYLAAFDVLADAFRRTVDNSTMIDHWDALTAEIVENF